MSDYDCRYNAHISSGEGVAGVSIYADTFAELLESEARYQKDNPDMRIRFVDKGYADHRDCEGGTIVTRRSLGPVPESEYRGANLERC